MRMLLSVCACLLVLAPATVGRVHAQEVSGLTFERCGSGKRITCVVDGDTLWISGAKIRLADINTPEVSRPSCPAERRLGERATTRFIALLNHGAFRLETRGRDEDRFGRKLRIVTRGGASLGEQLVREGLAERWNGKRRNWC